MGASTCGGIEYRMPIASAQVNRRCCWRGYTRAGRTCITEPAPTRDHTERHARRIGYPSSATAAPWRDRRGELTANLD